MRRNVMLGLAAVIVLFLAAAATAILQAKPGPESQAITGMGIGQYGTEHGIAYLSGQRLACANTPRGDLIVSDCRADIAGKTLVIHAERQTDSLTGICSADYGGQAWGCWIGNRHVHVGGFAYIDEPLGLSVGQMNDLRQRFLIENMPEDFFLVSILIAPLLVVLVVILGALAWPRASGRSRLKFAVLTGAMSVMMFFGTAVFWTVLTSGLWD